MFKQLPKMVFMLIILSLLIGACSGDSGSAGEPIEFTGDVASISGTTIVVGGFNVDTSNAATPIGLAIGDTVRVTGTQNDGKIIAVVVVLITDTESTPVVEVTAEMTDVVETTQEVEPTFVAEATDDVDETEDGEPLIVIEGPVQEINIGSITIFDIDIEVDPADPILTEIRIGDTIRVEGISSLEGDVIIIVAVNITIIEATVITINNPIYIVPGIPANCHVKKSGKVTCKNTKKKS